LSNRFLVKEEAQQTRCVLSDETVCNWLCEVMCSGKIDLLLTYVTDEAQFYINSYVNSQNKK
jgi:hypothetical protein